MASRLLPFTREPQLLEDKMKLISNVFHPQIVEKTSKIVQSSQAATGLNKTDGKFGESTPN
jgi:hypothetical protein